MAMMPLGCGGSSPPSVGESVAIDTEDFDEPGAPAPQSNPHTNPHGSMSRADYGSGAEVRLRDMTFTAPAAWKRSKPGSSYYMVEFTLPHVDPDTADGRLTISSGVGSVESNIDVFEGQFDGTSEFAKPEKKEIAGLQVTFVDMKGGYTGQHAKSGGPTTQAGYRMIVAITAVDEQLYFIKAVGPQRTIAANVGAIEGFLGSAKRSQAAAASSDHAFGVGRDVRLKPLNFTAPESWKRTKPRSAFVQVEFALESSKKDEMPARLTVSAVGGTVKENIDRWKGQFVETIENPVQKEIEAGGLKATVVDLAGTFGDQAGMMGPVVKRADYRMIGIIIPVDDQLYVVKAVGPRPTIAANAEAIDAFVKSVKQDK
jgi:hypothetical protein